jgi:hypothetical protein
MEPIREREARLGACSELEASEVQGASRGRVAHDGPAPFQFARRLLNHHQHTTSCSTSSHFHTTFRVRPSFDLI